MIGEVLAPASSFDMLYAAANGGADAVYVGLKEFNARRNADNFTLDELKLVTEYCHIRGILVYLTFNILIKDSEFDFAVKTLGKAAECGIDAVIVQDLGLASVIKNAFPFLPMHASTQLSVHNLAGIRELEKLGFSRVCLAREMSYEEIEYAAQNSNIEIEVFVHGAHCMSVSGQCYFSAMLGGRSGNRGLCGQVCRLPFDNGINRNSLSLKDMSIVERIPKLLKCGVCSFKIEGRMKRPEYVFSASDACKKALTGDGDFGDSYKRLQNVFSRSGFTDGYFKAKRNADMFGVRTKQDIAEESLLKSIRNGSLHEYKRVGLNLDFSLSCGSKALLTVSDGVNSVSVEGDIPEKAVNREITPDDVKKNLSKLGQTPYFTNEITCDIESGLTIRVSEINRMRREAVEKLSAQRAKLPSRKASGFEYKNILQNHNGEPDGLSGFIGVFNSLEQIPNSAKKLDLLVLPFDESIDRLKDFIKNFGENRRYGLTLPRVSFGSGKKLADFVREAKKLGIDYALCNNLYAWNIAKQVGMKIIDGPGMNIANAYTAHSLDDSVAQIVSIELKNGEINRLKTTAPKGIFAYGYIPLMLTRACPMSAVGCKKCRKQGVLTDRMGEKFRVLCHTAYQEVLNSKPLCLSDRLGEFDCDCFLLSFTDENRRTCDTVIKAYLNGERYEADGDFTRGLYYRGVM